MISFNIGKLEQSIDIQRRLVGDAGFRDEVSDILLKYIRGDWGDTSYDICRDNTRNAVVGGMISAQYRISDGTLIFVTTDAAREKTMMTMGE